MGAHWNPARGLTSGESRWNQLVPYKQAMKVAIAAHRLLIEVATAHGGISPAEAEVLECFRLRVGITKQDAEADLETPVTELAIEGTPREREAIVLAMARVAYADKRLSASERRHIIEVAARLGLGRVQVANIIGAAKHEQRQAALHGKRHTPMFTLAAVVIVAALFFATLNPFDSDPVEGAAAFREIVDEHREGVLLIHIAYDLCRGVERRRFAGDGTGFFATHYGLIVTNKHVSEPWEFLADRVCLLDDGYSLDESPIRITAWLAGSEVFKSDGTLSHSSGWDTRHGALHVEARAPDHRVRGNRTLTGGGRHKGRYHALDNADLVLLRAQIDQRAHAIPMVSDTASVRALDQVLVLGFPRGTRILEDRNATPSPSIGNVSKVEGTIMISAPIHPGNSGGPVLDRDGHVIGVAARRVGGETLGRCIRVAHVHALLASNE